MLKGNYPVLWFHTFNMIRAVESLELLLICSITFWDKQSLACLGTLQWLTAFSSVIAEDLFVGLRPCSLWAPVTRGLTIFMLSTYWAVGDSCFHNDGPLGGQFMLASIYLHIEHFPSEVHYFKGSVCLLEGHLFCTCPRNSPMTAWLGCSYRSLVDCDGHCPMPFSVSRDGDYEGCIWYSITEIASLAHMASLVYISGAVKPQADLPLCGPFIVIKLLLNHDTKFNAETHYVLVICDNNIARNNIARTNEGM